MYTAKIIGSGSGSLGALPAILVAAIMGMVESRLSSAQIAHQLATQYEEMKRLSEAQLTDLAILLGRQTDVPEWQWFNLLRSARDMALFRDGGPGNGGPGNGEPPPAPAPNTATWIAIGAAAILALVVLTK